MFSGKNSQKRVSILTLAAFVTTLVFNAFATSANAAGVAVTVSSPADGEFAASTDQDVTFGYVTSSEYAAADVITVTITPAVASAVANCAAPTVDADGDTTDDGAFGSFTTSGATYTFTDPTTDASTTGVDLCLNFQNDTATGIYSIAFTDTNGDYGATLIYVGDDNDVTVTANVAPTLSLAIRNDADTADTNVCALGTLTTTTVEDCAYRIKVSTNSTSGYTVTIDSDGDLRLSGSGDVADNLDIDPIAENGTIASGTEGYGIVFNGGAATAGSITESGDFNDDDTPIPMTATTLFTSDGPNAPTATDTTNTALVTHEAAIDASTSAGSYTQIVTYLASASF